MRQALASYSTPSDWSVGASPFPLFIWFCLFCPLVSARFLPGSSWRVHILRLFGAKIGVDCRIKPGLRVKYPWKLSVGDACWLGENSWIDNISPVCLCDRVCISQGVYLCTGNHDYRSPGFDLKPGPIFIESDVWIAAQSIIAPGIIVRRAAVITLGSVVTKNVESGSIVSGNPAKINGFR